jgi:CHASE1-domain containing sensor protein
VSRSLQMQASRDGRSPIPDLPAQTSRSRPERLLKWWLPGVVFILGVALTIAILAASRAREQAARKSEFERGAAQVALSVQRSFDVPLEVLRSVPALFEASSEVTRAEFRAFVRDALARNPWIYALEWIPRVPGAERSKFEAAAVADGLAGYHFKQDAPSGPPVPAETRSEYFPLFYMEPPNAAALGLEETALDVRKAALERARDLGTTAVTERLKLVQDAPSVVSVIAFHPVYERGQRPVTLETRRQSLRGFAAVVFRLEPVVKTALRGTNLEAVDVVLTDIDARAPRNLLYESRPGASGAEPSTEATSQHVATIAGRRWESRVADRAGWVRGAQTG